MSNFRIETVGCGNGICDIVLENECNCPEDCGIVSNDSSSGDTNETGDDDDDDDEDNETDSDCWTCTRWSECEDGKSVRECTSVGNCTDEQPREERRCREIPNKSLQGILH